LVKNSFSLIEVIFSLIIISIVVAGFSNILISSNNKNTYNELNMAYNNFINNQPISSKDIIFIEKK